MADIVKTGRSRTWSLQIQCRLCSCEFIARWNDVYPNPYPVLQPEYGRFCIQCPECAHKVGWPFDPRGPGPSADDKTPDVRVEAKDEQPITEGRYR